MALEMTGSYDIPVPREKVWEALNDPAILKRCIPGCEELERTGETELRALVVAKVGPVKAKFKGKVFLSELDPPSGYRISGEGDGGIAGFAKGGAKVELSETQAGTTLVYTAEAQIGGKLAQLGQRLVAGTAKKTADEFFKNFAEAVTGETHEGV
ncbi:CoxG family protein [Aquabacter cavernae]|uniref:CoxG family protein n=1 Tax=Aquabacter cavernae TaxID=2496029 RepID=UPI0013E026FE|nr:carbon monoxide dehydrogenase subunit G [Aquabacter cavernae]